MEATLEATLEKMGGMSLYRHWQKRTVRLEPDAIRYSAPGSWRPGVKHSVPYSSIEGVSSDGHVFKVHATNKAYEFRATSDEECSKWTTGIFEALENWRMKIQKTATPTPGSYHAEVDGGIRAGDAGELEEKVELADVSDTTGSEDVSYSKPIRATRSQKEVMSEALLPEQAAGADDDNELQVSRDVSAPRAACTDDDNELEGKSNDLVQGTGSYVNEQDSHSGKRKVKKIKKKTRAKSAVATDTVGKDDETFCTNSVTLLDASGQELHLGPIQDTMLGRELIAVVAKQHPLPEPGILKLYVDQQVVERHESLAKQGVVDGSQLTYRYTEVSSDLQQQVLKKNMRLPHGVMSEEEVDVWHSFTTLVDVAAVPAASTGWPCCLRILTFDDSFDQSIDDVTLPWGLESLTFGTNFAQSLEMVKFPSGLQSLTFRGDLKHQLEKMNLPSGLQSLTFGGKVKQKHGHNVPLPSGLQNLMFGDTFNQSLGKFIMPDGLQSLTFGRDFNQSLEGVVLASGLQSLVFGQEFNQSLDGVELPKGLQNICFGSAFNQSLEGVKLPSGLSSLNLGNGFDQSLEKVTLPRGLESLVLGNNFKQKMTKVNWPSSIRSLSFGAKFKNRLENLTLPSGLQTLTFGGVFKYKLERIMLPSGLQTLRLSQGFNQSIATLTLPEGLQHLVFSPSFDQPFDDVVLPSSLESLTLPRKFRYSLETVSLPPGVEIEKKDVLEEAEEAGGETCKEPKLREAGLAVMASRKNAARK
eukprot:TRINITY_DN24252_c0_g1_i1.p1 TRINITY_DN24252_c0_g1~~TRINITY_DN24252_c0_g1_i1.p1  ORF type:complete len:754 (-),score=133.71 TRINITY_DN24252_c0_g1_i1:102-2363(-)